MGNAGNLTNFRNIRSQIGINITTDNRDSLILMHGISDRVTVTVTVITTDYKLWSL